MSITSDIQYWNNDAVNYDTRLKKSQRAYETLLAYIKKEVNQETRLLDIGTGTGEIPLRLSAHVKKIDAIDSSPEMIKIAINKAERAGITNISFLVQDIDYLFSHEATFDVITIINLLHVVPNPDAVLEEAKKRLKKDGKIILATYLHDENIQSRIISYFMKRKGHPIITRFNCKTICSFIEKSSLKIIFKEKLPNIMPIFYVIAVGL